MDKPRSDASGPMQPIVGAREVGNSALLASELDQTDGHCALCGRPATHVCHCPECADALAEDGDDPDAGRPMCDACGDSANTGLSGER